MIIKKDCPKSKKLIDFYDNHLNNDEKQRISDHVNKCKTCMKKIQLFKKFDKLFSLRGQSITKKSELIRNKTCISDALMYKYIEGMTTDTESIIIENHINSCDFCLSEFSSLLRNVTLPASDVEVGELSEIMNLTPGEQVDKILSYYHQQREKKMKIETQKKRIWIEKWLKWINRIVVSRMKSTKKTPYWKPAFGISLIILIIIAIHQSLQYYNTEFQIWKAETLLLSHYRIFIEDVRLSGNYKSSGISVLMGPEDESSYINQAKRRLKRAISHGAKSIQGELNLAQIYIIRKQYEKADSLLSLIQDRVQDSAPLLNDRGVLLYKKKDWQDASHYFQKAIETDPTLGEAYFNLALASLKQNRFKEAVQVLETYVAIEHDKAWKNAGYRLKEIILKRMENSIM